MSLSVGVKLWPFNCIMRRDCKVYCGFLAGGKTTQQFNDEVLMLGFVIQRQEDDNREIFTARCKTIWQLDVLLVG